MLKILFIIIILWASIFFINCVKFAQNKKPILMEETLYRCITPNGLNPRKYNGLGYEIEGYTESKESSFYSEKLYLFGILIKDRSK